MTKKLSGKKRRNLTVADVYNAIHLNHTYPADMAKFLRRSRQYMTDFCKRMYEEGKLEVDIKEGNGKVCTMYKIKKTTVNQSNIGDYVVSADSQQPYFSDGSFISFGILEHDEYFKPDKVWDCGPTLMEEMTLDDCSVRVVNKKTIMFRVHKVFGPTPQLAYANMIIRSLKTKDKFLRMYPKFKLTEFPTNEGPGNIGTLKLKPIINDLNPKLPIKTDEYTIDSTPERGSFEMKIKDNPLETAEKLQKTTDFLVDNGIDKLENKIEKLIYASEKILESIFKLTEYQVSKEKVDIMKELEDIKKILEVRKKPKKQHLNYVG